MNDKPGETPNPLNPSSPTEAAQPNAAAPAPAATPATAPAAPATTPASAGATATQSTTATPNATVPAAATASEVATAPAKTEVGSLDPTGRSMEQATPAAEPPKKEKKKTGLIIGIIVGLTLLIGGIVAAVVMLMNNKPGDPVAMAMQKIMSGQTSKNVAIDGDINILLNDDVVPFKRININLDSDVMVGSMINTSSAVLTITDNDNKDYSVKFKEVYAESGDLYFEVEGASTALEESGLLDLYLLALNGGGVTDCDIDSSGNTDCTTSTSGTNNSAMSNAILGIVKSAEGVWIRLSTDDLNLSDSLSLDNSTTSCVADFVKDMNKNSNSAVEIYNKYPFVISSNENIPISSKQSPVYQVSLDSKNFTGFINAIQNTEMSKSLYSCMGWENNLIVAEEDVEQLVSKMPKVYTEVNSNNDFTRLYLETDINDGVATATIDLGISYPTNINVTEPVEYKDYSTFVQEIFSNMYNLSY